MNSQILHKALGHHIWYSMGTEHRALAPRSLGQQGVHERRGRSTAQCTFSSQLTSRGGAGAGAGREASEHAAGMAAGSSLQALLAALINCAQ